MPGEGRPVGGWAELTVHLSGCPRPGHKGHGRHAPLFLPRKRERKLATTSQSFQTARRMFRLSPRHGEHVSGMVNMSAAWYMLGHKVRSNGFPGQDSSELIPCQTSTYVPITSKIMVDFPDTAAK